MSWVKLAVIFMAVGLVTACANSTGALVRSTEPHGIVDLDIPRQASNQYEAFFLAVDGQNVVSDRKQLLLRPGKHEIRLGARLENLYGAGAMSLPGNRASERSTVSIEVKEGVRYSVAAKLEGNRTDQWVAIVSREAPLVGYVSH